MNERKSYSTVEPTNSNSLRGSPTVVVEPGYPTVIVESGYPTVVAEPRYPTDIVEAEYIAQPSNSIEIIIDNSIPNINEVSHSDSIHNKDFLYEENYNEVAISEEISKDRSYNHDFLSHGLGSENIFEGNSFDFLSTAISPDLI